MEFVKLAFFGKSFSYDTCSSIEMCNLGIFLTDDVGNRSFSFKKWLFNELSDSASNNATILEKKDGFILIRDMYSEEEEPTQLRLTYAQFLQILDDWEEKVIKLKPREVIIKHENGRFIFETN